MGEREPIFQHWDNSNDVGVSMYDLREVGNESVEVHIYAQSGVVNADIFLHLDRNLSRSLVGALTEWIEQGS